jgi:hypothetical protein
MAWWLVERWEALRLALGARGSLAARGGYVNPASKGCLTQHPWRLPPLHPLARFARDWQNSDAQRRENVKAWLFEIRIIHHVSRVQCGILHAAPQSGDPGAVEKSWARLCSAPLREVLRAALRPGNERGNDRDQNRSTRDPASAPMAATSNAASVYQVATNSGESSVQCAAYSVAASPADSNPANAPATAGRAGAP